MAFPPEVFIIGAQRSGTTSLAYMLDQHPMVVVSDPKETDFLTMNWERGREWYRSRFRREDAILIDASPSYSMAPVGSFPEHVVAPKRAFSLSPNAKFIYMVRDPAERSYSAYWHEVRAGREKRSLRDAIGADAYYGRPSFYFRQLQAFLEFFPLDRFLIVEFGEFSRNSRGVARDCAKFIGADRSFEFQLDAPKNQAFTYNRFGKVFRDVVGEKKLKHVARIAADWAPSSLHPALKAMVRDDIPRLSEEDRSWLAARYRDDAVAFEQLTGIHVAHR